jgi:transposase
MTVPDAILPYITAGIPHLKLEWIQSASTHLDARPSNQQPQSPCPSCGTPSHSIHSHYQRSLQDHPISNARVQWTLLVRRFRCRAHHCKQRIFCERFTSGLTAYARWTNRVRQLLENTALHIGANPASKLIAPFGFRASPTTLLRRSHEAPTPNQTEPPRIIGIDDFAFRKRDTYGTIIVDHERGQVIDLLPDRTPQTVQTWLKTHPSIEVITRDRSHEYANACTAGAPQAQQVLERWHLLKNLREALENLLRRSPQEIAAVAAQDKDRSNLPRQPRTGKELVHAVNALEARRARIERARALHAEYGSIVRVAAELPASKTFVRRAIRSQGLPDLRRHARHKNQLEPWVAELETRFQAGMRNAMQFWRELQALGFGGSYAQVQTWVKFWREQPETDSRLRPRCRIL